MSRINVDKITGATGTASGAPITLSGDTATLGSGVAMAANHSGVKTALNATGDAPIYACRAWVHFNGGGSGGNTPSISASGNISSITDLGTGLYTCNFATALEDEHYVIVCGSAEAAPSGPMVSDRMIMVARGNNAFSSSGASVHCRDIAATTDRDQDNICVAVFR